MFSKFNKTSAKWSLAVLALTLVIGCSSLSNPSNQNDLVSNNNSQPSNSNAHQSQPNNTASSESNVPTGQSSSNVQRSIETPRGLIWNPRPAMNNNNSPVPPLVTPFSLYLSPSNSKQLQTSSAETILTLPLTEYTSAGQFNVYLNNYFFSDNWIIYSIFLMNPGMVQPYSNQLRAVNIDSKKDILLTNFYDAGGDFFSIAVKNDWILYSQKTPGPGVSYVNQIAMFNLNNGQKMSVDQNDLKVIPEKNVVNYSKNGQTLTFQLQLGSTTTAFE
ncbi:hypothetical protein Desaci_0188 [Desulfosporosinus acidiphilus SJ4]|uniref:Lipoprotein n=1 Tax=Desulfosporosinus acidiphilus (strain DSM 22704 / JCM 16185 / SJ4) TaxID=646529 RepID=I4D0E1_DESAJ|nr:hypothetical protein [Desulfosporosinus acidiphilus]AFM39265.1 hypothetical protein Desaci_0188 [Desulfosporosinus acidiphilus SJ4]